MAPTHANVQPATAVGVILERGQAIDRFVVLGLVGRGGMGEVYAAYDPELDRKVAIKLLRVRGTAAAQADGTAARTRLLREAQAIAKLSHPNVVVVYDVGTFRDSVFVAMEFVEGGTVGHWLHAAARSWREVMKVFLAAGRGLAAAHAAGLMHRDFKPDNVMVTRDGQVRVMDFGLARQIGEVALEAAAAPAEPPAKPSRTDGGEPGATARAAAPGDHQDLDPDATAALGDSNASVAGRSLGGYLSVKLTQTGAMLGTPAYMSPEQFATDPGDARTDQFSFCVALYEGLYGERPFAGDTFVSLMSSVTAGAVKAAPAKTRVPGWVRKVLLRGLQADPDRRFPSMNALLAALETDPTVRVRRTVVAVAVLACLGGATVMARRVAGSQAALCQGGAQRLAGIWEPQAAASARKTEIHRAFAATGRSYAEQAFTGVSRLLDQYSDRWLGMYAETCEATQVRGDQSAEVMDLRMGCLQERLVSVRALVDVFATADGTVVENAVSAAGALPHLDRCADVALLRAVVKPPQDEATRRRVEELRGETARLNALRDAGHCAQASLLADGLLPRVKQAGYLPLLADTLNAGALLGDECGEHTQAVQRFHDAYTVGLAAHHDEAAARAAIILSAVLFDRLGQREAGRQWLEIGRAMIARLGGNPLLESWLLTSEGAIFNTDGDGKAGADANQRAIAIKEKLLGKDHPDVFRSLGNKGWSLHVSGHYDESLAASSATVDGLARVLGQSHPMVAMFSINIGETLNAMHRYAEARAAFRRSLEIWRQSGADAFLLAYGLTGEGLAYLGEGKPAEAAAPLAEALRIRVEKHVDAEHLGEVRFGLAQALWATPPDRAKARALARQARADYAQVKTAGPILADIDAWLRAPATTRR